MLAFKAYVPVACPLLLIETGASPNPPMVPMSITLLFSQSKARPAERLHVPAMPTTCPLSLFPAGPGAPPQSHSRRGPLAMRGRPLFPRGQA